MKSALARGTDRPNGRVLVLGPRIAAAELVRAFEAAGIPADSEQSLGIRVPPPRLPSAFRELETFLKSWSDRYRGSELWVHPGLSEWADRAEWVQISEQIGITPLGPSSRTLTKFSHQLMFLGEAEKLGIPNLVRNLEPLQGLREVTQKFGNGPWPMVLKSVRGRLAGFGIRVFRSPEDLQLTFPLWAEQLRRVYGEAIVYGERYLEAARFIGVPFARDHKGVIRVFPMIDSSLMSRCRKVLEVCPPQEFDAELREKLEDWTQTLAESCAYTGVGFFEFLVDGDRPFLVEALPQFTVGFKLWSSLAGVNPAQVSLAAHAGDLGQLNTSDPSGCAMSLRVFSENSTTQVPFPGTVLQVEEAAGLQSALLPGESVPFESDGLIAVVTGQGSTPAEAMDQIRTSLRKSWIFGSLQTNESYLAEVLVHPWLRRGLSHASFLDEEFVPGTSDPAPPPALWAAAVAHVAGSADAWWVGNAPVRGELPQFEWSGPYQDLPRGRSGFLRREDGSVLRVGVVEQHPGVWTARMGNHWRTVRSVHRSKEGTGTPKLFAQATGRVRSLRFRTGEVVPAHQAILVIESLQSLVPHAVPVAVRLGELRVQPDSEVQVGQILALLEKVDPPVASL